MNKRNISVTMECFVKRGNKYLMLHRGKHKKIMPDVWMAPGGHVEFDEGLFEATKREIKEETGLEITNLKVKAVGAAYLKDLNQELFFHFLIANYKSGKIISKTGDDGEFAWLTQKQIAKLPTLLSETREVSPYIFNGDNSVISYKAEYEIGNKMTKFLLENPK